MERFHGRVCPPQGGVSGFGPELPVRLECVEQGAFNRRFRVHLRDGHAVECVLYRGDTLCVSSQVGCAVGCPFCASGAQGLVRPLGLEELWGQVSAVGDLGVSVARLTVSGVGEPLHNWTAVRELLERCRVVGIRPSLTTSGGPLARLSEALAAPHNGLTVSVHAGSEQVRSRTVPRGPGLGELFGCLASHWSGLSQSRRRKVALAYLLLAEVNDSDAELDAFADRVLALPRARVHLYAHNPVSSSPWHGPDRTRYAQAAERLRGRGLYVQLSSQARLEANGGCGTLVMRKSLPLLAPLARR